jgi:putative ABC transport system permease protein
MTSGPVEWTSGPVGWIGLAVSGALVLFAVGVSVARRLGLGRTIVWSSARALAQLLAVGGLLVLVIDPKRPIVLSWCWVAAIVLIAADTVRRRVREVRGAFILALLAFSAAAAVTLGIIFGCGVFPVEGKTVVPLGGMMVGNSMMAIVLVARRIVAEVTDKRLEVEARLALGWSARASALPYVRAAVRDALVPQLERTKATGLIFLPGAMTGLILAGVDPLDAVLVQVVVMYLILASTATTTAVVAWGVSHRLFTPDQRLRRLPRRENRPL